MRMILAIALIVGLAPDEPAAACDCVGAYVAPYVAPVQAVAVQAVQYQTVTAAAVVQPVYAQPYVYPQPLAYSYGGYDSLGFNAGGFGRGVNVNVGRGFRRGVSVDVGGGFAGRNVFVGRRGNVFIR